MTQAQLAEQADLDNMTISRFETGLRAPSLDQLERLAFVFNVPVAHFLNETDETILIRGREIASMLEGLSKEQQIFITDLVRIYVTAHGKKCGGGSSKISKKK